VDPPLISTNCFEAARHSGRRGPRSLLPSVVSVFSRDSRRPSRRALGFQSRLDESRIESSRSRFARDSMLARAGKSISPSTSHIARARHSMFDIHEPTSLNGPLNYSPENHNHSHFKPAAGAAGRTPRARPRPRDTAWTIIHVLFLAGVERRGHAEIKMSPLLDTADQKS